METPDNDEDDIAHLLRSAGRRRELPEQLKVQWEGRFRSELEPVLAHRRRRRRSWILGLCAAVVIVAATLTLRLQENPASGIPILVSHASGNTVLRTADGESRSPQAGQELAPGATLVTGPDSYLAINWGDYDVRLNAESRVVLEKAHIALEAGEVYASDPEGRTPQQRLRIETPHSIIRDIGTQFSVALWPYHTVATVRRGAVLVNAGGAEFRAEAGTGAARRITVKDNQRVYRESVEPSGPGWQWIYRARPGFELEGASAYDFLLWSARESGLRLVFTSEAAEIYARTTLLHGDIGGLDPERAVEPVLATGDLVAERGVGNTLRISLGYRD